MECEDKITRTYKISHRELAEKLGIEGTILNVMSDLGITKTGLIEEEMVHIDVEIEKKIL